MENNQTMQSIVLIEDLGVMPISVGSKHKKRFGLYKCSCGIEFKTTTASIKSGNTKSCGCKKNDFISLANSTHKLSSNKLYHVWSNMIDRTTNKQNSIYSRYGGRGITVCERWMDVSNFVEDMYPSYQEGLTIDRINNDGNYEPSNCRWATKETQSRNTRIIHSSNTSGYRGVCFNKRHNRWLSSIKLSGKSKYIGEFHTAIEAAVAYDSYVIENNLEHNINNIGELPEEFKGLKDE